MEMRITSSHFSFLLLLGETIILYFRTTNKLPKFQKSKETSTVGVGVRMGAIFCSTLSPRRQRVIDDHQQLFRYLGLSKKQGMRMAKFFWSIDIDDSSTVSYLEFIRTLKQDNNKFNKNVFLLGDTSHDGALNFTEFIIAYWNICTIPANLMAPISFECYLVPGESAIHVDTLLKIVDEAMGVLSSTSSTRSEVYSSNHGAHYDPQNALKKEERQLKRLCDQYSMVHLQEFLKYVHNHETLLKKIFVFQDDLRRSALSFHEWEKLTQKKVKLFPRWGYGMTTPQMLHAIQKHTDIDRHLGGRKLHPDVDHTESKKSKPNHDGNKYVVREKLQRPYTSDVAATKIQSQVRRKLVEKRQRDGKLHPHNVSIGGHWVEYWDSKKEKHYFVNTCTKESRWTWPEGIPHKIDTVVVKEDWKVLIDPKTKKTYYYNRKTKCTSWKCPWAHQK